MQKRVAQLWKQSHCDSSEEVLTGQNEEEKNIIEEEKASPENSGTASKKKGRSRKRNRARSRRNKKESNNNTKPSATSAIGNFGKALLNKAGFNSSSNSVEPAATTTEQGCENAKQDDSTSAKSSNNDYYISKIRTLERAIAELRKTKQQDKSDSASSKNTTECTSDSCGDNNKSESDITEDTVGPPSRIENNLAQDVSRTDCMSTIAPSFIQETNNDRNAACCQDEPRDESSSDDADETKRTVQVETAEESFLLQEHTKDESEGAKSRGQQDNGAVVVLTESGEEARNLCNEENVSPVEGSVDHQALLAIKCSSEKQLQPTDTHLTEGSDCLHSSNLLSSNITGHEEEANCTKATEEEDMNYFRSRFLHRDTSVRTNSSSSSSSTNYSEAVLRDYRHRRKQHRYEHHEHNNASFTPFFKRNIWSGPSSDEPPFLPPIPSEAGSESERSVCSTPAPQPKNEKHELECKNQDNTEEDKDEEEKKVSSLEWAAEKSSTSTNVPKSIMRDVLQKSGSFRRRRRDSGDEQTNDDNPFTKRNFANTTTTTNQDYNSENSHIVVPKPEEVQLAKEDKDEEKQDTKEENIVKEKEEEEEEEEEDPLDFIHIKSAAQWMAVSKRISWNFDETPSSSTADSTTVEKQKLSSTKEEEPCLEIEKKPVTQGLDHVEPLVVQQSYDDIKYDIFAQIDNGCVEGYKPTKVQQLRLVCWKVKPWKQPKPSGGSKLFCSQFALQWGVDCDEVHPNLFIGDKASASNVGFLRRYGITHVLNAAEGNEEGLVNLSPDHYVGSGITYLGFPLWDTPGCNVVPYLGCAAEYIASAIDGQGGKCLVNCQMGVSRSASCAMAYLLIKKGFTSVEALTTIRKSRDCRPNDGFLQQLANVDNELRKERERGIPMQLTFSSLTDRCRLPLCWHREFWIPGEVTEEELGFGLANMGEPRPLPVTQPSAIASPSFTTSSSSRRSSREASRRSSKRNSFRSQTPTSPRYIRRDRSSLSQCSKRSRPTSTCLSVKSDATDADCEWEWVWEDEEEEEEDIPEIEDSEEVASLTEKKLEEVKDIIARPEEKWRILNNSGRLGIFGFHGASSPGGSSRCSGFSGAPNGGCSVAVQAGVDDGDPLAMVKVASAKQWKVISRKLTINLDDLEDKQECKVVKEEDGFLRPATPDTFKCTTAQQLRLLCWRIKPWDQQRKTHAERQLFTSLLGAGWGVDCDEVYPGIFVGDEASARNIAFLRKVGITHVLNTAEGKWTDLSCVDITEQYYQNTGITYLGLPLWDSTQVRILPYLGGAAEFIASAVRNGQKCLVHCQMGVSRSCTAAMAYLMLYEDMTSAEVLRTIRTRRDVRPNDYFLEQVVELDNDLRKERECGLPRTIHLPGLGDVQNLAKPWHFEFWHTPPDDLPFSLTHNSKARVSTTVLRDKQKRPDLASKRVSMRSSRGSSGSDWEWEYYDETDPEE